MKRKANSFIETTSYLLFTLVVISSIFVVNIYAKYIIKQQESNESSVASFLVDVDIKDTTNALTINENINYEFTPGSKVNLDIALNGENNEVKVKYIISIKTLNNLPIKISHNSVNLEDNSITGEINPLENSFIDDIIIEWPQENNLYSYSGQIDLITVSIVIEQID